MTRAVTKAGKKYFWSDADKHRGAAAYVTLGSFEKASNVTGISESTLRMWARQDWWGEECLRVDKTDTDNLKSTYTRIAKRATEELEDRLNNGDEIVTKDGEVVKKKIGGRDLAIIAAVASDKRKQAMEQPHSVPLQSSQEKLMALMESFIKFTKAKTIEHEVIDAEQPELQEGLQTGVRDGEQAAPGSPSAA